MREKTEDTFDVIIIGAGAAGLMCAGIAGQRGKSVLLIDHAKQPGQKITISGGGRCNFTNLFASADDYVSANPHFCKSALSQFPPHDFIELVERYRIPWVEKKHGQLFCARSARDIVEMLLAECQKGRVSMLMNTEVSSVSRNKRFEITAGMHHYAGDKLVIASGGLSLPKIGASPFGLKLAEQFGLSIQPPRAALVPLTFTGQQKDAFKQLAGVALDVQVTCKSHAFRESMLFTHRGLSGPAILQISLYWNPGDLLTIDLLPDDNIRDSLNLWQQKHADMQLSTALSKILPRRLSRFLCHSVLPNRSLKSLRTAELDNIAKQLHGWQIKPAAHEGYRTAEVTRGGVDTHELSSRTMESRKVPGLFFIGEVVDVTGRLGGFNFQWAWSSAYACGQALQESDAEGKRQ